MLKEAIYSSTYLMLLIYIVLRFNNIKKARLKRKEKMYAHEYGSLQDQRNVSINILLTTVIINVIIAIVLFLISYVPMTEGVVPILIYVSLAVKLGWNIVIMGILGASWGFYLFSEIKHISPTDGLWKKVKDNKDAINHYKQISIVGALIFVIAIYRVFELLSKYKPLAIIISILIFLVIWCGMADLFLDDDYNNVLNRTKWTWLSATSKKIYNLKDRQFLKKRVHTANQNFCNIIRGIKNSIHTKT